MSHSVTILWPFFFRSVQHDSQILPTTIVQATQINFQQTHIYFSGRPFPLLNLHRHRRLTRPWVRLSFLAMITVIFTLSENGLTPCENGFCVQPMRSPSTTVADAYSLPFNASYSIIRADLSQCISVFCRYCFEQWWSFVTQNDNDRSRELNGNYLSLASTFYLFFWISYIDHSVLVVCSGFFEPQLYREGKFLLSFFSSFFSLPIVQWWQLFSTVYHEHPSDAVS